MYVSDDSCEQHWNAVFLRYNGCHGVSWTTWMWNSFAQCRRFNKSNVNYDKFQQKSTLHSNLQFVSFSLKITKKSSSYWALKKMCVFHKYKNLCLHSHKNKTMSFTQKQDYELFRPWPAHSLVFLCFTQKQDYELFRPWPAFIGCLSINSKFKFNKTIYSPLRNVSSKARVIVFTVLPVSPNLHKETQWPVLRNSWAAIVDNTMHFLKYRSET